MGGVELQLYCNLIWQLKTQDQPLSFSELENEFGRNGKRSLGDYRVSDNYANNGGDSSAVGNLPLDDGIPQSGTIRFSDFYSKRLNMVVDYYSLSETKKS